MDIEPDSVEPEPVPLGRLILVIWPAYGVLAFSIFVSWKLRSAPAVTSIAAFVAGVAVVLGGVGFLKAKSGWLDFEARTTKAHPAKRKRARSVKVIEEPVVRSEPATAIRPPDQQVA